MGQGLESSAERRLQSFRRDLTLDLFTRNGPFWDLVEGIRHRWGIAAGARIPPTPRIGGVHLPADLLAGARPDWPPEAEERFIRWKVLLEQVHEAVVPPDLRVEDVRFDSVDFWDGFLSACLVYDPPATDLLGFADHPEATYDEFRSGPLNAADRDSALQMLAPPIKRLYDAGKLVAWERDRHERLIGALHARLGPRGIDVWEMVYDLEYFDVSIAGDQKHTPRRHPYIEVTENTTGADVRNAFTLLAADLPRRPRAARPSRDLLTAVQCAIWYDDLGWSQQQIAGRFGWATQSPPASKVKSETARQHIADGRDILRQRKVAA